MPLLLLGWFGGDGLDGEVLPCVKQRGEGVVVVAVVGGAAVVAVVVAAGVVGGSLTLGTGQG